MPDTSPDELRWWSAVRTADAIHRGSVTAVEVREAAIARIERIDPRIGAVVIPLFDRARAATTHTGPFTGVPTLLKDVGEELAGTPHWAGARVLADHGHRSHTTTGFAAALEALGMVFVGKSACPELSASSTTEPPGFAPTRNPWDVTRSAGGSSGGAAAAVAAGLVPIAHGSDGTGSLRFPASHCGVVTLKPSRGRVPITPPTGQRDHLRAWTQFALARDIRDLAALFAAVAVDGTTHRPPPHTALRVGLLMHDPIIGLPLHDACAHAVHVLGDTLSALGHHVEPGYPRAFDALFGPFWEAMSTITPVVRREQLAWLSGRLGRPVRAGEVSDELFDAAQRARDISAADVSNAYATVRTAMSGVEPWWDSGFDLLATPVLLRPAWPLGEDAPRRTGLFCAPFSFTGQPALVVPVSRTDAGLPVGVQLVGRRGDDEVLLAVGAALQDALGWLHRRPPIVPAAS